jgi:hypothetical protein
MTLRILSPVFAFFVVLVSNVSRSESPLDYNRDVRPILSEHCFACHGFDEKSRQADLRLDQADSAYLDRDGTIAVKPGKLDESEAWKRIISEDEDLVMPPTKAHIPLEDDEKTLLRRWIEEGAAYAGHWSFIAPTRMELPKRFADQSPIDAFILDRLEKEKIQPSPEADRATLIRRVTLDLTGLPPSGNEVLEFLADTSPIAYENLVDRLLRSPHFGERIALDWMDAARYADTNGFSIDGGRHMWLWRDWVIQSFNDNLPYDRFIVEQLAGDLLPDPTDTMKIASGFQRNNMVTHEGGTIPEENLTNYNADRVKTLGESMLGLTLGCAQCHDHKFDPISQRDYYQMFAFFNTLSDRGLDGNGGVNPGPFIKAKTVIKTNELPELQERVATIEKKLATLDPTILESWERAEKAKLDSRGKDFQAHSIRIIKVSTPNRGGGLDIEQERLVRLTDTGPMGAFDISTEMPKLDRPITAVRVVIHTVPELPGGGWGYGPDEPKLPAKPAPKNKPAKGLTKSDGETAEADNAEAKSVSKVPTDSPGPNSPSESTTASAPSVPSIPSVSSAPAKKGSFMLTALAVTADSVPGDQVNLFKLRDLASVTANSWDEKHPPARCLDPRNDDGWAPDLTSDGPVHLTASLVEPIDSHATPFLTVQLNFGSGQSLIPQLIELQVITGNDDGTDLPDSVLSALQTDALERTTEQAELLWSYCSLHTTDLERDRIELANLRERISVLTEAFFTMVMDVAAKPRDTYILNRGDYSQPTERVEAGTPESLPAMDQNSPRNRLGLAKWLVSADNPLTARVAVNRFWKLLFGTGLVGTPADFGSQGEWPSHPELLDWLAVDFRESDWDVKALLKQIVMSSTYRQDSRTTTAMLERDPQNRLLARGPRFRLPAELIRDAALKTSGLLVARIGGPSVNPYMPGDLWREVSHYGSTPATAQTFIQDHGEKLYRRSLYTYWKRTAPPPNMTAFDAPNREVCTIARGNTMTPLQALVTLNDVQFVEASRAFATRILLNFSIATSQKAFQKGIWNSKCLEKPRGETDFESSRHLFETVSQGDASAAEKLRWAFLEATSRPSTDQEIEVLNRALNRELARYAKDLQSAREYLSLGESPLPDSIPLDELAAWSQVAAMLLNLSESVIRP